MSSSYPPGPEPESKTSVTADPPVVTTSGSGDTVATRFLNDELRRARASLQMTRIASVLLVLLVGGELLYLTSGFVNNFQPQTAAEIVDGMVMQQINDKGPDLANQLKQKVPEYMAQAPDYVLKEMPNYRQSLEDRIEKDLTGYCKSTSDDLGKHLDTYLDAHKDNVKELLTSTADPASTQKMGADLKAVLMDYIKEAPAGKESIYSQINQSLSALQEVQKTTHHLATATNLTPDEKKARRAIAIITQSIDEHRGKLMPASTP